MTAVQNKPTGRIVSTVTKDEVLNLGSVDEMEDREVSWHVESRDRLRLQFEDEDKDTDRPTTLLRYDSSAGSFTITIPAALAYGIHAVGGELNWDTRRGNLYASVASRSDDDE